MDPCCTDTENEEGSQPPGIMGFQPLRSRRPPVRCLSSMAPLPSEEGAKRFHAGPTETWPNGSSWRCAEQRAQRAIPGTPIGYPIRGRCCYHSIGVAATTHIPSTAAQGIKNALTSKSQRRSATRKNHYRTKQLSPERSTTTCRGPLSMRNSWRHPIKAIAFTSSYALHEHGDNRQRRKP